MDNQDNPIKKQPKVDIAKEIESILGERAEENTNNISKQIETMLGTELEIPKDPIDLEPEFKERYKGFDELMVLDIQVFTNFVRDTIPNSELAKKDASELEKYRTFSDGFLHNRGIFYSNGIKILDTYPELAKSSIRRVTNNNYTDRYMIPIKMPNGDVYTWMGYDPQDNLYGKYNVAKVDKLTNLSAHVHQGSILGNLESLELYNARNQDVIIVEGMMDAYQVNDKMNLPSIALLGSILYREKVALLETLKKEYNCRFIYAPDFDIAGLNETLINSKLWDDIYNYNVYLTKEKSIGDIDDFLRTTDPKDYPPYSIEKMIWGK